MRTLLDFLERRFHLSERETSVAQEIASGVTTFLSMAYVLLLNPRLLSKIGIPFDTVVFATAVSSSLACFIVGYFGNLPFGLAPGIGLSAYFIYGLVLTKELSIEEAFASCFLSGMLLCAFSVTGVSALIMNLIPKCIKLATIGLPAYFLPYCSYQFFMYILSF